MQTFFKLVLLKQPKILGTYRVLLVHQSYLITYILKNHQEHELYHLKVISLFVKALVHLEVPTTKVPTAHPSPPQFSLKVV